jgi:hypothetical protein
MVERRCSSIPVLMVKKMASMACLVLLVSGTFSSSKSEAADRGNPLWSREVVAELSRIPTIDPLLDNSRAGIIFLDEKRLIVYDVERDLSQLSSRTSPETSSPFRLHLVLLDTDSGKLELYKDWGTRLKDSAVQVTSGGVLVKTGEAVKLFSPDFSQSRPLPITIDPNYKFSIKTSPSGKTIGIHRIFRKEGHRFGSLLDILDANTLRIKFSWQITPPLYSFFSISDAELTTAGQFNSVAVAALAIDVQWHSLQGIPKTSRCPAGASIMMMVSDHFLVGRDCQDVLLASTEGERYSLDTFNGESVRSTREGRCEPYGGRLSDKVAVASGASLVALALPAVHLKKDFLQEARVCLVGIQIGLYDLTLKKRVSILDVEPLPKNDFDFALSPDGSKLAVLSDRKVSFYFLPIQPIEKH